MCTTGAGGRRWARRRASMASTSGSTLPMTKRRLALRCPEPGNPRVVTRWSPRAHRLVFSTLGGL